MKFLSILFLLFSFLFATRIDLSIQMMQNLHKKNQKNYLMKLVVSDANTYSSKHFNIHYGDEYPYNTLWADYNKDDIPDIVVFTADVLENIYNKEVNEFNFSKPIGEIPINVYFANTGIYLNGQKLKLSNGVCGYAVWDGVDDYIVLNANPPYSPQTSSKNMLKVTLAHEFFHLIQYHYKIDLDDFNIWLYEGTAVLMEHLVYPEIPDYVYSYASTLLDNPQNGFIFDYGLIPYSSVLFFDYLSNKYGGVNFLKKIWEDFKGDDLNSIASIDKTLKEYNSSIYREVYQFYRNLDTNKSYLSNKNLIGELKKTILPENKTYSKDLIIFGALITKNNSLITQTFNNKDSYLISNNKILDTTFSNIDDNISILAPNNLYKSYFYNLEVNYTLGDLEINLTEGWNLITGDIDLKDLRDDIKIVWKYENGEWHYYSKVINSAYFKKISDLNSTEGIWVYSNKNLTIEMNKKTSNINWNLTKGWHLISLPLQIDLKPTFFKDNYIIWNWDNGEWSYYSDKIKLNFKKLNKIPKKKGFWIWVN